MQTQFMAFNGASPTTAAPVKVTTGTAIKTLMQLATSASSPLRPIEWGISFDSSTAGVPIVCELLQTDVAATVTTYAAADIIKYQNPSDQASLITLGASASGYTATAEGTITATRLFDVQLIAPTNQFFKQFPLSREAWIPVSKFLRIRVTAPVAVNALCYIIWEE